MPEVVLILLGYLMFQLIASIFMHVVFLSQEKLPNPPHWICGFLLLLILFFPIIAVSFFRIWLHDRKNKTL
ncbi:MAG: hypothetical protein WDZ40_00805 [Candidatus Spechtbacterales bacterium]